MAGETEVETTPAQPAELSSDKQEIVAAEAKAAEAAEAAEAAGEKKDAEKKDKKKAKEAKEKAPKAEPKPKPPPPPAVHKQDFEKDVVYLYQFSRTPALPNLSPYCLKTETWIKLNGIKYENVAHCGKLRSKRGLLPFVELNGEEIADSEFIIQSLGKTFEKNLDDGLNQEQLGVQHAMVALVDNHLHWCITSWMNRDMNNCVRGYKLNLQSMMGSKIPNSCLLFMMKHTYFRKSAKNLKAAGFGGYTNEEIDAMGKKDLKVLSELLGDKQFFFGDDPHSLDLNAFVWLALIVNVDKEVACPLRDYMEEECKNLIGAYNRMKDRAWAEHWDEATGEKMELNPHIPKPDPPKPEEKKEEDKEKAEDKKEEKKEDKKEKKEEKEKDNKEEEKK